MQKKTYSVNEAQKEINDILDDLQDYPSEREITKINQDNKIENTFCVSVFVFVVAIFSINLYNYLVQPTNSKRIFVIFEFVLLIINLITVIYRKTQLYIKNSEPDFYKKYGKNCQTSQQERIKVCEDIAIKTLTDNNPKAQPGEMIHCFPVPETITTITDEFGRITYVKIFIFIEYEKLKISTKEGDMKVESHLGTICYTLADRKFSYEEKTNC